MFNVKTVYMDKQTEAVGSRNIVNIPDLVSLIGVLQTLTELQDYGFCEWIKVDLEAPDEFMEDLSYIMEQE